MSDKLTKRQIANRRQWIAALRSGKYTQGKGFLYRNGAHCCLGVAVAEGLAIRFDDLTLLSTSAATALGMCRGDGLLDDADLWPLDTLNDSGEWTFSEIADLVELDTEARS